MGMAGHPVGPDFDTRKQLVKVLAHDPAAATVISQRAPLERLVQEMGAP